MTPAPCPMEGPHSTSQRRHRGLCVRHYDLDRRCRRGVICETDGCAEFARYGNLCSAHGQRAKKHGETRPDLPVRKPSDDPEYFWVRVDKTETCWRWTAAISDTGYGTATWRGKTVLAHRLAYELAVGPISAGLTLDHLCRVRECVNPAHLEPVTIGVNVSRNTSPTSESVRTNKCYRGHEFTPENTAWQGPSHSKRTCRTCRKERQNRRAARLRGAA